MSKSDKGKVPADPATKAQRLQFAYHPGEDRLVLTVDLAGGAAQPLLVTRRLAGRLLNGIAALLARSSAAASRAAPELRDDVILLEHQSAVAAPRPDASGKPAADPAPDRGNAPPPQDAPRRAPLLLENMEFTIEKARFVVRMNAGGKKVAWLHASRGELHRVLDVMTRLVERADWRIEVKAEWLSADAEHATIN